MTNFYSHWALRTTLLLAPAGAALAQAPVITSVTPLANARAAARTSPLTVNFSQPLTAASAGALKVFSSQRGGLRSRGTTPAVVSGNALSFAPTAYPFMPGETVQYTVSTAAAGGGALAQARVGQFTTAVGGAGRGNFQPSVDLAMGGSPTGLAVGDVNNDGNLDILTAVVGGSGHGVNVLINHGAGAFASSQTVWSTVRTGRIKLQDVDGDGDLDLLIARLGTVNFPGNTVGVCLNSGGTFGLIQTVAVDNNPYALQMADVDGDGDMDLLVACESYGGPNGSTAGTVNVRLNDGSGTFGGTYSVAVGTAPLDLAVGDVDGDGDVDMAVTNGTSGTVSLRLNAGDGTFSGTQELGFRNGPGGLAMGDVDGDGDLDLLVLTSTNNVLNVRLNDGSGIFSGTQSVSVGSNPTTLAVGDVDGDGDLDVTVNSISIPASVAVRLNDGSGTFSGGADYLGGDTPISLALGDLDGDGDLDLLTGNYGTNTVSFRLNAATALATAPSHAVPFALFPNPAHGAVTLTGNSPNAPLTVLDALGRVRLRATTDATGTARLALPAGLYVVRCGGQAARLAME